MQRLPIIAQSDLPDAFEAVQRAAIEASGLPISVERWERKPHQLADAIAALKAADIVGALITSPHKERAVPMVGALSDDARQSGAIDVIVHDGARLRGHNTDVDGVRAGLEALLPKVKGKWPKQAMVLGAGGGARAVVSVLIGSGFGRVAVFNRHLHRAEALVAHFARSAKHMELRAMPWHEAIMESELAKAKLLVNTTLVGIDEGESPVPSDALPPDLYLLDLVLARSSTPLMSDVRERGGNVANGQASFLRASAVTFRLLTGQEAPPDIMRQALTDELGLPDETAAIVGD